MKPRKNKFTEMETMVVSGATKSTDCGLGSNEYSLTFKDIKNSRDR